jgi:hypothetical protein
MDQLEAFHKFATEIAGALNKAQIKPIGNGFLTAVMIVVGDERNERQPPVGGSLNYDKTLGFWVVTPQLEQAQPL